MTESVDSPNPTEPASGSEGPKTWVWWAVIAGVIVVAVLLLMMWRASNTVVVPSVMGLSQEQATLALEGADLTTGQVTTEATLAAEPGTVIAQSPVADEKAAKKAPVDLTVAEIPVAAVPDVIGMTESDAEAELASSGLRTGDVEGTYSDEVKPGVVMTQSPVAGEEVEVASFVSFEISLGPDKNAVPDVVGLTSTDAEEVLDAADFKSEQKKSTSDKVDAGLVISQSPEPGVVAESQSTVKITVSTGPAAVEQPEETTPPTDSGEEGTAEPTPSDPAPETPAEPETPAQPEAPKPEPPAPKPETVQVPNLLGMGIVETFRALRDADLGFKIAWGPTAEDILRVIEQDPDANTEVDPGTVVTVTFGLPEFLFEGVQVQPLPAEPAPAPAPAPESKPTSPSAPETATAP